MIPFCTGVHGVVLRCVRYCYDMTDVPYANLLFLLSYAILRVQGRGESRNRDD